MIQVLDCTKRPAIPEEYLLAADRNGCVGFRIKIELSDLIENDLEGVLDLISEQCINSPLLSNLAWDIESAKCQTITLRVRGDIGEVEWLDSDECKKSKNHGKKNMNGCCKLCGEP